MERWTRWIVALAVFATVFGASLAVAGTTTEPVAPEDSPALFGTPESQPGDRGMYKTALVVVKDGRGEYFDMHARYAFERLDDRLMPGQGGIVPVASFVGEWRAEPYHLPLRELLAIPEVPMPDCAGSMDVDWSDPEDEEQWEADFEACMEAWEEEFESGMEAWEEEFEARIEAWADALDREFHTVRATGWHVTHHAGNATAATSYRDAGAIRDAVALQGLPLTGGAQDVETTGPLVFTEPLALPGPCGWRTSLQTPVDQPPQDMWDPIIVHGECPADMELGFAQVRHEPGPIAMRVSGRDRVHGQDAVVFSMPEDPDRLRLWFTKDNPYPVRILTRTESVPEPIREALGRDYQAPAFYVLHELIEFEAGHAAPAPAMPPLPDLDGMRGAAGPELGAFAHPWPVEVALADASDPAKAPESCRAWRDWAAAEPDLTIRSARLAWVETEDPGHEPIIDAAWTLVATGGGTHRAVVVQRHTETVAQAPLLPAAGAPWGDADPTLSSPSVVDPIGSSWSVGDAISSWSGVDRPSSTVIDPVRVTTYSCAAADVPDLPPPAGGKMPPVDAAAALLRASTGTNATDYAFHDACLPGCAAAEGRLTVGTSPAAPGGGPVDLLTVGPEGGLRLHVAAADSYPEARFSDPQWDPRAGADPWGFAVAGRGAWNMPQPATAATLAAAGAAAGGLLLVWPALKALLAALPMFSRIRDEDLLEHPVRNQIHQVVTQEPGIHFQEMVRRVGKGRGTTEHHLRKLVGGGVLVEKAQRGFTCYFPKGRIDRNLMVAAPLLKSQGARQILHALQEEPGAPALDVAQRLGIATSTVNYHVKKLMDAGLLDATRDGRYMRLRLTGVGEQALGQYGGT